MAASASEGGRKAGTRAHAARAVVDQCVAGESSEDAVAVARTLRSAGLLVTLDYLGEETTDAQRAAATAAQYVHLLGKLAAEGLTEGGAVEVSVKPTAVGLLLGTEGQPGPNALGERVATEHLERIVSAAADAGTTVTIDAEDHRTTDAGLRIAGSLRSSFPSVGTVLQAALRRTEARARGRATAGTAVGLCKGAYAEPASEAFDTRHDVDKSFARCLRVLMTGPGYPMIATPNPPLPDSTRSPRFGAP